MPEKDPFQIATSHEQPLIDLTLPENRLREIAGITFAYSDNPDATCPSNILLADCQSASKVLIETGEAAEKCNYADRSGDMWNTYAWTGRATCESCALTCEGAAHTRNGTPTGLLRLAFIRKPEPIADNSSQPIVIKFQE